MRKVVHIITKFAQESWAGAENAIVEISKRLPDYGFKSEVYSILAFSSVRREMIRGTDVRRFWGFYPKPGRLTLMRRADGMLNAAAVSPSMLWSLATRKDIAVVHLHCHGRLSTSAAHVCWHRRLPFVYTIHSLYDPKGHTPLLGLSSLSYEWGVRRANRIIAVAPREVHTLRSVYPDRAADVRWIPNGVDTGVFGSGDADRFRREYDIPARAPLFLHVGRIYSLKNQLHSVRLLAEILKGGDNAFLAIVGPVFDEAYFRSLNEEIEARGLRSRVRLVGGLQPNDWRLSAAYGAADVALLPSQDEAHPLVVLEAWAAGLGVLASDIENLHDIIEPGITGEFLPKDGSLAEAVKTARAMIIHKSRYRDAARRAARKYSWDATARQIAGCYSDVLDQAQKTNARSLRLRLSS